MRGRELGKFFLGLFFQKDLGIDLIVGTNCDKDHGTVGTGDLDGSQFRICFQRSTVGDHFELPLK